jgi:hypothetical protein
MERTQQKEKSEEQSQIPKNIKGKSIQEIEEREREPVG